MKNFLAVLLILLCWCPSYADEEKSVQPEDNWLPYFLSYSVFPLAKDSYETIIQPQYIRDADDWLLFLYPQISYGVTDSWFVYFNFTPYIILSQQGGTVSLSGRRGKKEIPPALEENQRTSGLGDCDFGSQYSWMYINKSTFSAAVLINFHIPTGDINKNLTDGFFRYEPYVVFAKDFIHGGWRTELFSQTGISLVQRLKKHSSPEDDDRAAHTLILGFGIAERSEKVNLSLEYTLFNNTWNNNGDDNEAYLTPGIYIQAAKNVAVGLGVPLGLTKQASQYQIIGNILVDIDAPQTAQKTNKDENANSKKIKWDVQRRKPNKS
ncbi:MAG: transporter [Gammaproteobacteria bacterium]|nr:transporter [Gammaproteobacteria bacterium]